MKFSLNSIATQTVIAVIIITVAILVSAMLISDTFTNVGNLQALSNHATLQRSEVFRLSEFARRFNDANSTPQEAAILTGLNEATESYHTRQSMFIAGDDTLGIVPIDETHLLHPIVVDMGNAWHRYRSTLVEIDNTAQEDRDEQLGKISTQAALLYSLADRLERGIQFNLSKAQEKAKFILLSMLGLLVFGMISTSMFLYLIVKGLNNVQSIAQQYEKGDYAAYIKLDSFVELTAVSMVLHKMAAAVLHREQSLTTLNQSLELRVEERTNDLRQARDDALIAQTLAQENSRLKSEFLSTMSHELRTPLNAILGYVGLLLMGIYGELNEEVQNRLRAVEASSKHLLGLINDVLDLAKIEAGKIEFVSELVNIDELVTLWAQNSSVLAEQSQLSFDTEIDSSFPKRFQGDKERLTQIVTNLVSNAIKFTERGGVSLKLKTDGNRKNWIIEVHDTGQGIAPEAQEYIFDQFRQVDGSYSRNYGGTGLGLAIVKKLVEEMGGTIHLRSKVGEGSVFSIILPLMLEGENQVTEVEHGH